MRCDDRDRTREVTRNSAIVKGIEDTPETGLDAGNSPKILSGCFHNSQGPICTPRCREAQKVKCFAQEHNTMIMQTMVQYN